MNSYFKQLLEWIKQNENIEEQELIQALFLLRAHYSLAGIVVICQRIFTLIGDDELPEFRDELNTLKIISRLQDSDCKLLDKPTTHSCSYRTSHSCS